MQAQKSEAVEKLFCRLKRGAEPMRGYGRVFLLSELQDIFLCNADSGEGGCAGKLAHLIDLRLISAHGWRRGQFWVGFSVPEGLPVGDSQWLPGRRDVPLRVEWEALPDA